MNNFEFSLAHVLKAEGGFVSHPLDRGRETNMGITRATLEAFRGKLCIAEDVKNLTIAEASAIYKLMYWDANRLDSIKHPVIALVLFDQIVNRRASEVIRGVQIALSNAFGVNLATDGILGPQTADTINGLRPEKVLVTMIIDAQTAYISIVERSPKQAVFLKGWLARTWKLLAMV